MEHKGRRDLESIKLIWYIQVMKLQKTLICVLRFSVADLRHKYCFISDDRVQNHSRSSVHVFVTIS
jgi:hypothetical protein